MASTIPLNYGYIYIKPKKLKREKEMRKSLVINFQVNSLNYFEINVLCLTSKFPWCDINKRPQNCKYLTKKLKLSVHT